MKDDLEVVVGDPPKRKTQGLLNDHYEDGNIFNLVELMETTQWSAMEKVTKEYKGKSEGRTVEGNKGNKSEEEKEKVIEENDKEVKEEKDKEVKEENGKVPESNKDIEQ